MTIFMTIADARHGLEVDCDEVNELAETPFASVMKVSSSVRLKRLLVLHLECIILYEI